MPPNVPCSWNKPNRSIALINYWGDFTVDFLLNFLRIPQYVYSSCRVQWKKVFSHPLPTWKCSKIFKCALIDAATLCTTCDSQKFHSIARSHLVCNDLWRIVINFNFDSVRLDDLCLPRRAFTIGGVWVPMDLIVVYIGSSVGHRQSADAKLIAQQVALFTLSLTINHDANTIDNHLL